MNLRGIALLFLAVQAGPAVQNPGASVEGIVVESGTNNALSKTTLELRSLQNTAVQYPAFSSAEGRFAFRSVPPGRYSLTAARAGYLRAEYGQRGPNGTPAILVVAPEQHIVDVRISMTPSGAISGRVHDREGEPIANAQMHAWKVSYPDGWRMLMPVESMMTDDRGEFRLFGLPPGLYCISAQPEPRAYVKSPAYASLAPPVPGAIVVGSIAGSTGGTADPANASRSSGADWAPVYYGGTTDEFSAAQLDLRAGDDMRNIDIVVDRIPLVSIRGTLVDAKTGEPVRSATVAVTPTVPGLSFTTLSAFSILSGKLTSTSVQASPVRSNGEFISPPVPGGSYLVTAIADQEGTRLSGQTVVDVRNGNTVNVKISLSPAAEISGRIVIEGGPPGDVAAEMEGLRIGLTSAIARIADVPLIAVSASGAFTLRNVAPGDYLLNVAPLSNLPARYATLPGRTFLTAKNAYVKSARLGNIDILSDGFRFVNAPDAQIEVVIGRKSSVAVGTVVDDKRVALPDITVVLLPDESHRNRIDLYQNVVTGADGRFRFEGIPPGRYRLFAWEDVEKNSWRNPSFMRIHEQDGTTVTVGEGTEETVELKVIPWR